MASAPLTTSALLDDLLGPLLVGDGGQLYVVSATSRLLSLHIRGRFSGCPGNTLVVQQVLEPALRSIAPECRLIVTNGELVPDNATLWQDTGAGPAKVDA